MAKLFELNHSKRVDWGWGYHTNINLFWAN